MFNAASPLHMETTTDVACATLSSHMTKPAYTSEATTDTKAKALDINLKLFDTILSLVCKVINAPSFFKIVLGLSYLYVHVAGLNHFYN
jgi:hypothetical protein